jgi:peptidoglycan/LPS O-acetylase OafA/YrhL
LRYARHTSSDRLTDTRRSSEIDCLRILSASTLFYWHVGNSTGWPLYPLSSWTTGVFVTASTYCAVRFSRHRSQLTDGGRQGAWSFVADRFVAVYPAYAIVTMLIFAGSFLHPAVGRVRAFSIQELAINLSMLNAYIGVDFFTAPMWFIPFIFQVYALIPLLARFLRWPKAGLVGTTALSVLASLMAYRIAPREAAEICRTWSPIFRLPPGFLGVALGMLPWSAWPGVVVTFVVCVAGETALMFVFPDMQLTLVRQMQGLVALALLTATAFLVARLAKAMGVTQWWTTLLGQASFPFFLTHAVLVSFIWSRVGNAVGVWLIYFVACWIGAAGFALIYRAVIARLRRVVFSRKDLDRAAAMSPRIC